MDPYFVLLGKRDKAQFFESEIFIKSNGIGFQIQLPNCYITYVCYAP